jgi:hypothetical protein
MTELYALEVYAQGNRAILEVHFDHEERQASLQAWLQRLGSDATGYRMGTYLGDCLADGYEAVDLGSASVEGPAWAELPVTAYHTDTPPQRVTREKRERSLSPAEPLYQADVAEMLREALEVRTAIEGAAAKDPEEIDLVFQAQVAGQVVNCLEVMAAASTEEMARQQRDILSQMARSCVFNGWHDISDPVIDFVVDTRRD